MSNSRLATLLALAVNALFFSALLGALLVFRFSSDLARTWPDSRAAFNALILSGSVIFLWLSNRMRLVGWVWCWRVLSLVFIGSMAIDEWPLFHVTAGLWRGPASALLLALFILHAINLIPAILFAVAAYRRPSQYSDLARLLWTYSAGLWLMIFAILKLR